MAMRPHLELASGESYEFWESSEFGVWHWTNLTGATQRLVAVVGADGRHIEPLRLHIYGQIESEATVTIGWVTS
jgi:hypothetical protein